MKFRVILAGIIALIWADPSWAEGRCPDGYFPIGGGDAGWEGCAPMGGDEDEGADEGDEGAASMRYYSPEEWKAFFAHMAEVDAKNQRERILMGQRHRQLEQGLWFMPGEEPFAGWSPGSRASQSGQTNAARPSGGCTVSYWTLDGAVAMSTLGGRDGPAVISYMGYSIPAPEKSRFKKFALTQSGKTQTVNAMISKVGRGKRTMGIVSFAVPSGNILVGAIADVQDYSLADNGRTIFSGQWHDGLRARAALAQCLAQSR